MNGKIIKLLSGIYTVLTAEGTIECTAKGGFRKLGISPVPGDLVEISVFSDHTGRIEKILPRNNYLIRPNVSNIDALCYVSSFANQIRSPLQCASFSVFFLL
jgi:ribosome biogenesis GTPase